MVRISNAAPQSIFCLCLARLVTHPVQPHGRPLPLHHQHLCLASMEVSLPFSSQRGTLSAGGAQGRRRGAGYLGRRSIDLSGALRFLKPNWEKIFQKRKSFFSWCSWLLCVYLCQFLKRPVWRKISMCKINFNSKIQKSKLKRNLWDEISVKTRRFFSLAERGGTPPPLTESPLSFSGKFFPKRAKNDVFFIK